MLPRRLMEEAREAGRAAAEALYGLRQPTATPLVPVQEVKAPKRAASGELEESAAKRAREADTREPADEPGGASTPAITGSASTPAGDAPIAIAGDVPVEPAEPPKAPTKPAVPTAEARDIDTYLVMPDIIRYVLHQLHARLASHPQFKRTAALHEQQPLTIRAGTDAALVSYKTRGPPRRRRSRSRRPAATRREGTSRG